SARPSSRPSGGRCAWPPSATSAPPGSSPRPRARSDSAAARLIGGARSCLHSPNSTLITASTSAMTTVAIIDYGMGNLRSVAKAIEFVAPGHDVFITSEPARVAAAERVVFPGQGAMPDCMRELDARGLRGAVLDAAAGKPFLGICIGQQMLFEHSAEGDVAGLGILPGKVVRFPQARMSAPDGSRLKIPQMGWNE